MWIVVDLKRILALRRDSLMRKNVRSYQFILSTVENEGYPLRPLLVCKIEILI